MPTRGTAPPRKHRAHRTLPDVIEVLPERRRRSAGATGEVGLDLGCGRGSGWQPSEIARDPVSLASSTRPTFTTLDSRPAADLDRSSAGVTTHDAAHILVGLQASPSSIHDVIHGSGRRRNCRAGRNSPPPRPEPSSNGGKGATSRSPARRRARRCLQRRGRRVPRAAQTRRVDH